MRPTVLQRLGKLEAHAQAARPTRVRYEWIKSLPLDFEGARHLVIVNRQATGSPNIEWYECEERAGEEPKCGETSINV